MSLIIEGSRIYLRDVSPEDARAVQPIVGDSVVTQTLTFEPKTLEETREYLRPFAEAAEAAPRTEYYLGVIQRESHDLIGTAFLGLGEHSSGNIGYAIRRDEWDKGYATEATRLLIDFGFRKLGLHRIWASHGPANPSSGRVLLKAGMTYEGTLRQNLLVKGHWRDSLMYSILVHEWNASADPPGMTTHSSSNPRP